LTEADSMTLILLYRLDNNNIYFLRSGILIFQCTVRNCPHFSI